jgi:cell division protein FtsW (lipid II flippase)
MAKEIQQSVPTPEAQYSVPWSVLDSWLGILLLALVNVGLLAIVSQDPNRQLVQSSALIIVQLAYLLPLVLIFTWRRISWKHLGFGSFD